MTIENKTYKDGIVIRREVTSKYNNKSKEVSYEIEDDYVSDVSSARIIVNHLIKKFDMRLN